MKSKRSTNPRSSLTQPCRASLNSSGSIFARLVSRRVTRKFGSVLLPFLEGFQSYLDLGCGRRPVIEAPNSYYVCLDRFLPYLEGFEVAARPRNLERILADVRSLPFRAKSIDCVLSVDLLEHLEKDEGSRMLKEIERIAERRIVIVTPNGYLDQDEYDGNPFQIHRSAWDVREFEIRGYSVFGFNGLRLLRGALAAPRWRPQGFWNEICEISQPFVWRAPRAAFHTLAVKDMP